MRRVEYDDRMHQNYARARAMDSTTLDTWLAAFAARLPDRRPLHGLDLGSGTGRFTPALADAFGPVTGVEPSDRMRAIAEHDAPHPRVRYLPGSAERIPLPADEVDYIVMFLAWHHVGDKAAAARDMARVAGPDGTLLLRTQFADRMPRLWWLEYFPRGHEADASMYDTVDATTEILERAGWQVREIADVTVQSPRTRAQELERLRFRGLSTFEQLTEDEIAEGFERLERAVVAAPDQPVPRAPASMLTAVLA